METEPRQNPVERKAGFWNMSRIGNGRRGHGRTPPGSESKKAWPQRGAEGAKKTDWFLRLFAANQIADLR
jgi:hypothetical protein